MSRFRLIAVLLAGLALLGAGVRGHLEEGNRKYGLGDFRGALEAYTQALAADPEVATAHYNLGNALYRLQDPQKALLEYAFAANGLEREARGATPLSLDATYNAGNAAYAQGLYKEALDLYARVLLERPEDMDAKRNLELTLRRLEQQQQEQQQEKDGQDQEQEQEQEQRQQEGEEEQEQEDEQESPSEPEQQQSPQEQSPQPSPPSPEEISKEQIRQLLEELQRQEAEAFKEAAQERLLQEGGSTRSFKDW